MFKFPALKITIYQKAIIALIITNSIWGAASPIFKWSLKNIPPFSLAFLRFYFGALILALIFLIYKLFFKKRTLSYLFQKTVLVFKEDFKNLIFLSLCGIVLNITFFFYGLRISSAINAPIIASSGPVFTFFFSIIFLQEKFKIKRFTGMIIALLGVILIVVGPILDGQKDDSILGNLFFIIATFGAVGQTIFGKKIYSNHNFVLVTLLSFIIGAVCFFPLALNEYFQNPQWIVDLNYQGITGIAFGAIFSSTVAYSLLGFGLSQIPASEVALFTYIDPVIAALIAIPLLGEQITVGYLAGAVLVLMGIFVAEKRIHYHPLLNLKKKLVFL